MHIRSALNAAALLALISGCAVSPPKESMYPATLTLQPQQSASVAPGATLAFERMDDSRCPANARCVWAGKIVYYFGLTKDASSENFALDATAPPYQSASLPGLQFALAPFDTPPARTTDTLAVPHAVTLTVTLTVTPTSAAAAPAAPPAPSTSP